MGFISLTIGSECGEMLMGLQDQFKQEGFIERYKVHLVEKCFPQREGIDYIKTFSLVAKINFVRFLLSLVAHFGCEVHYMDVRIYFLHGYITKEIYVKQPHKFEKDVSLVCRLNKSLYGLK